MSPKQNHGQKTEPDNQAVAFPLDLELVPGFLWAEIHLNEFLHGDKLICCWTMLSKGFASTGQKEIQVTVRIAPEQKKEDYPKEVLEFFKAAFQFTLSGLFVDYGSVSEFGKEGFLSPRFKALGYVRNQPLGDWQPPKDCMAAIALTENEYETAKTAGLARVTALMGKELLHFPCPTWNDLERKDVLSPAMLEQMKNNELHYLERISIRAATASVKNGVIELVLPVHAKAYFADCESRDDAIPLCILTDQDPQADAVLVWHTGSEPLAITSNRETVTCTSGSFVCFAPAQNNDYGVIVDDGFLLSLKTSSWSGLKKSLALGSDFSLTKTGDGSDFRLRWSDYVSPTSRNRTDVQTASSCSQEESSSTDGSPVPAYATRTQILTEEAQINKLLKHQELKLYIDHIEDLVRDHFFCSGEQEGFDLLLECSIEPGRKGEFQITSNPSMEADEAQDLAERLSLSYAPEIARDSIKFRMHFAVWGGITDA